MKALYLEKDHQVNLRQVTDPVPTPGEALIRVRIAGICRTDIELTKGYMDFEGIPGHEFVGEVVAVNETKSDRGRELVGKRVVGEINCGCGKCAWCASGLSRHCSDRTVLGIAGRNGALAEYLTLPISDLKVVPDNLEDQSAVFTEPLAAALEILEQVMIKPQDRVLVIGDGKLGLLVARVLQIHGCDLSLVGLSPNKLAIARSWGIKTTRSGAIHIALYDVVVEASGSPEGFATAVSTLKPRGTLVLKSTYAGTLSFDSAPIVIHEITVVGSRCGPFEPALRYLAQGLVPVKDLISAVFPFHQCVAAVEYAAQPDCLKVLLNFSESDTIIEYNPTI